MNLMNDSVKKTLVVILGPTAVGKTSVSIKLAEKLNTEIISADSRQFYNELKIGTCIPSEEELKSVKHHFIGHLSINDYYNVSRFETDVLNCLNLKFKMQNLKFVLMVGGSGLYINAVCNGIDDLPDPDEQIRLHLKDIYKNKGIESLQIQLKKLDPVYYNEVDIANPNRLIRALEVCIQTGRKYSELRTQNPKPRDFRIIKIGLQRDINELYNIINNRVDRMIADGLVNEARNLLPCRNLNALNTVGYKELFLYFDGILTLTEAITKIKTNTRHYAKRQLTWFRKDKSTTWFHPSETNKILDFVKNNSMQ
jgi:tRNA dimethylallyltransferase